MPSEDDLVSGLGTAHEFAQTAFRIRNWDLHYLNLDQRLVQIKSGAAVSLELPTG